MLMLMKVLVIAYFVYLAWRALLIWWEVRSLWAEYQEPVRLVVQVRDQEQGVEGLVWRLVRISRGYQQGFEVVVVDCGSQDDTAAILARMPLPCGVSLADWSKRGSGVKIFDARGLMGRQLLGAPVFSASYFR